MKYYGRAESVAETIIEAFKTGAVPKALAPVLIRSKDNVPCRSWSWSNQLLCILNGTNDARGIRQWSDVGRVVKRRSKPFDILVPVSRKTIVTDDQTNEEKEASYVLGFKTAPVFPIECTEGDEVPLSDTVVVRWINTRPLLDVARSWRLKIAVNAAQPHAGGNSAPGSATALDIESLSGFAHQLMRAADERLGQLAQTGQHWRTESVTEFGGRILLEALSCEREPDSTGYWTHISSYAQEAKIEPVQACMIVLKRTCDAVNLLLAEAGKLLLSQVPSEQPVQATLASA